MDRNEIVEVALRILEREPSRELTLRRLGDELGVTAASLYGYFGSKQALEDAVVAHVMPAPPTDRDANAAWHGRLRRYIIEIHDAFAQHPGAAAFLAKQSTSSSAMDAVREHLLELLIEGGLTDADAISALGAISRYLMGCVAVESQRRKDDGAGSEVARLTSLSSDEFPILARVAGAYAGRSSVESTHFGLDLIIQSLITRAGG